jgi:dihydroflavonol-4-reductase
VAHVASPVTVGEPKDEYEVIRPAVEGTLSVLRACRKHKVKRVVMTSSIAAIENVRHEDEPEDNTFNEGHVSDPDRPEGMSAYYKSKCLAESAAWMYVDKLPDSEKIDLTVINPGFMVGPSLVAGDFPSGKVISKIMMSKFPGIPRVSFPTVDVRDVA